MDKVDRIRVGDSALVVGDSALIVGDSMLQVGDRVAQKAIGAGVCIVPDDIYASVLICDGHGTSWERRRGVGNFGDSDSTCAGAVPLTSGRYAIVIGIDQGDQGGTPDGASAV
jgi:hypothetical protein